MLETLSPPATPAPRLGGLDLAGVILSGLCLLHCTLLPVALAMLPFVGIHYHADERLHLLITVLVVPVAMLALITGFRRHRQSWIPTLGISGLVLILGAPLMHDTLGHFAEAMLTAVGGLGLICAHVANWRRLHARSACCARSSCCTG